MKRALEIRAEPTIHHPRENSFVAGDCLDVLRGMPDGSWDNVVTDAPYGIGFHYDAWTEPDTPEAHWQALEPLVQEWFRVVVPGGLVAIFQPFILGAAGLCLLDRGADLEIREAAGRLRVPGKGGACVP
jgi:DNA modification methylase